MNRISFFVFLAIVTGLAHSSVGAQSEPQFVDPSMTVDFGRSIQFSARLIILEGGDPVQAATEPLILLSTGEGSATFTDEAAYDPGNGQLSYEYTVQPGALTPFTKVTYQFQVTLADGSSLLSPAYEDVYFDTRFDWQLREQAPVRIHWYEGGADFAQEAVDAASRGLARIRELLPVRPAGPLDIYIYASPADLQTALGVSETGWIAGQAVPGQGAAFVSITLGPEERAEMERQIPHELAHLVHSQLAGPGWGDQPAWLREGIASEAELSANPDYARALQTQALIPLADLCAGFPSDPAGAYLAYAESGSFVGYLRSKYGASGLEMLTRSYGDGLDCEEGPARAFAAPLAVLEQAWLAGLAGTPAPATSARGTPAPSPAVGSAEDLVPMLVLLGVILIVPLTLAFSGRRRHE